MSVITAAALHQALQGPQPPVLVDVRRIQARVASGQALAGALWSDPALWLSWKDELAALQTQLVLYCVHGHEISQGLTAALRAMGCQVQHLQGGLAAWQAAGLPVADTCPPGATRWVTRERPKIDRIACPWLVARFIDPHAEFLYVPAGDVLRVAAETGAEPYDVPGVALSHVGDLCSFDAFMARYGLGNDPALQQLAVIVRGADTDRLDLAPQSAGLYALSLGLSLTCPNDHDMLRQGMGLYDALYAWCRHGQGETHRWPPKMG
jgi:rhodanese-related sulfurtransferase